MCPLFFSSPYTPTRPDLFGPSLVSSAPRLPRVYHTRVSVFPPGQESGEVTPARHTVSRALIKARLRKTDVPRGLYDEEFRPRHATAIGPIVQIKPYARNSCVFLSHPGKLQPRIDAPVARARVCSSFVLDARPKPRRQYKSRRVAGSIYFRISAKKKTRVVVQIVIRRTHAIVGPRTVRKIANFGVRQSRISPNFTVPDGGGGSSARVNICSIYIYVRTYLHVTFFFLVINRSFLTCNTRAIPAHANIAFGLFVVQCSNVSRVDVDRRRRRKRFAWTHQSPSSDQPFKSFAARRKRSRRTTTDVSQV